MRFVVLRDEKNRFGAAPLLKTGMLRVSKHSKIFRTAALVSHLLGQSGRLTIGSMGSGSVLQSMKSLLIAEKLLHEHNLFLAFQPRFISLQIGDFGKEKRSVLKIEVNIDILQKWRLLVLINCLIIDQMIVYSGWVRALLLWQFIFGVTFILHLFTFFMFLKSKLCDYKA